MNCPQMLISINPALVEYFPANMTHCWFLLNTTVHSHVMGFSIGFSEKFFGTHKTFVPQIVRENRKPLVKVNISD